VGFELPRTLTLPSGARVTLERSSTRAMAPATRTEQAPLFSEVVALFDADVRLAKKEKGARATRIDVQDLSLADFHVVRAALTKAGLVAEDEVEIACHNCEEVVILRPCECLETGPWEDGELGDPELDRTAPFGAPLDIAPILLGRVRQARTVTLAPRTVREAMPLLTALGSDPLSIDADVVRGMGITALGPIEEPARIARTLAECDDASFGAVTDAFLSAHYPLRLAGEAFCPKCKARNTVDAPALREFELGPVRPDDPRGLEEPRLLPPLPPIEDFVELAHAIAEPLISEIPGEKAELIVDDETPAVDEGGEPLLGSYVPPPPKDAPVATRPPTVTIYYRTFQAIEREEGPYDWEGELRETIEHELEHHVFYLRGDDPMDEAEHDEIDREALRVVGRAEARRRTLALFGLSIPDFLVRAWPLVLIGAAVLAITFAEGRCGP
jgi:hypothetical protein